MKADIISEKENPLRKRKEYWLMVEHEGKSTPTRHELLPEVAKKLGSKSELTVLDKIFSERGTAKSRVKAQIYSDIKEVPKVKLERQAKKVKKHLDKKQAAAAVPAAEESTPEGESSEQSDEEQQESEEPAPADEAEPAKKEEPAEEEPEEEHPSEEAPAEEQGNEKKEE
jgi:ribosomal protein S24E